MTHPPRLALWLHERSLAPQEREAVIGDLVEEFYCRAATDPAGARRWLWRQTIQSLWPNVGRRRSAERATKDNRTSEGAGRMNGLATDVKFAVRLMRRQPVLSVVAFTSLLVGLSLNVLLFTISNAVLFRPLAVHDPESLFVLLLQRPTGINHNFSYPDYVVLRDSARQPEALVAYSPAEATVRGREGAEMLEGELVSGNFFSALGVRVRYGRGLTSADDTPNAAPAAVISQQLWRTLYGGGSIDGKVLTLNGQAFGVIGVADGSFGGMELGRAADFWVPMAHTRLVNGEDRLARPGASWLTLMARLPSLPAAEAARQELDSIVQAAFEGRGRPHEPLILQPGARGDSMLPLTLASPLSLLSVAGLLVLLVACMNMTNLQLARADARRLELAVRAALGASRTQLVRLMVADALLFSVSAGIASLGIVLVLKDQAVSLIARFGRPVSLIVPVDARVVLATLALSLVSGLIVGLVATWQVARRHPADALGEARSLTVARHRSQQALVVAQFALSMAVLTGAAMLVRTLANLRSTDLGFDSRTLALLEVTPGLANITGAASSRYFEAVIDAISAVPGVQAAGAAHVMPLDFGGSRTTLDIAGYTPAPDEEMELNFVRVTPGYFQTVGIPISRGRDFTSQDGLGQPRRIVVNETMARRFWPDGQAVGRFVRLGTAGPFDIEVVGVVPDVHYRMVREAPGPSFYASLNEWPAGAGVIHARVSGDPESRLGELRRAVAAVNPSVPVGRVHTLGDQLERNIARERMASVIGVTLASATLLLAAAGLYSTMAFLVGRRTREIGVRVALGARALDVRRMVLRDAGLLVLYGAGAGLALALWAGRALETLLFDVGRADSVSLMASVALLSAAGLLAGWIPARRASRVDPVIALRES